MDQLHLQKLRDLPIEGVAERLGLQVRNHKCLCPFHNDHTPSLTFNSRRNSYRCFVCGASGGTIDLVMNYLHKDFLNACHWLSDEHNIITISAQPSPPPRGRQGEGTFDASRYERFFERPFLNNAARHFLYDERRLDPRVIRWCRLTSWADKNGINWLQIPYYDQQGKLIGIQNRNLAPTQTPPVGEVLNQGASEDTARSQVPLGGLRGAIPRFRFPTGSHCSIYNLPVLNLLLPGEDLYITEGCSDCWAMLSSGHKAIAIPSATLLSQCDRELLLSLTQEDRGFTFHMYPDKDAPGERLFMQLKEIIPTLQHHQLPKDCKDFSDYYLKLKS